MPGPVTLSNVSCVQRDALGLGLRPQFYPELVQTRPVGVDFFEIILENYLGQARLPREKLRRVANLLPIVGHGVSLNLLGSDALDMDYLSQVKDLIQEFNLPYVTDHLCWTAHRGVTHHDLLPVPYARELIPYAVDRARQVQEYLGVPFGIENLSSYVRYQRDDLPEWEFYRRVIEGAGCWYMLDINNVYVSSMNHGFSANEYLQSVLWDRVLQVHVAGHQLRADGIRHDTHDQAVCDAVWELYGAAWRCGGPFPTLLEWDAHVPPLAAAAQELNKAHRYRQVCVQDVPVGRRE
jgi:uncharacterized protein